MLELRNLSKSYHQTKVLENINFTIHEYDWVMLSGESGSGKTTLLNIMTGFILEYEGEIFYKDKRLTQKDFNNLRRTDFSIVFQEKNLILEYTVYQNMLIEASLIENGKERIDELLSYFHLEDLKHKKISELSGGQLQKISILRALLKQPKVLFLDEPTGNLDVDSTHEIMEMLKDIHKKMTIIMITHNKELFKYANRVIEIDNYHLIEKKNLISNQQKIPQSIKRLKSLPLGFMIKMGLWNFKYYIKTYSLGIILFILACTGFIFSSYIGQNIDRDLKDIMLSQEREYELKVFAQEAITKEDVQKYAQSTNALDYDLNLKLFSYSNTLNNKNGKMPIQIRSTYELNNPQKDIVITSHIYNQIESLKTIELDLNVLSDFDIVLTNYWVEKDYQFYKPIYHEDKFLIHDYEVIESDESIIYLSHQIIEEIADKNQKGHYSNQIIQNFNLKYTSYQEVVEAKETLDKEGLFETYSVYDDFLSIQSEMENQFMIFTYSSYILLVLIVLILCFIIFMVDQNKVNQHRIFNELGVLKKERFCIQMSETFLFFAVSFILSVIIIYITLNIFNGLFDIQSFLPISLLEFANMYHLPIHSIKWFHVTVIQIIKSLMIITLPTYIIAIIISMFNHRKI